MFHKKTIEEIAKRREAWKENTLSKVPPRKQEFTTISGIPIKEIHTPEDIADLDYLKDLGFPGEYPFTRGAYAPMNRSRPWTIRQVVGVGTAKETNERHKFVMKTGQTGMSNDFDVPTCIGLDSDHPLAEGEVGRVGVAIDTLADMQMLYEDIPLENTNHSFTINHPTPAILSMFLNLAEKQGVPFSALRGTTQNDPLKECFAMKMFSFPPQSSVKLLVDTWEFASKYLPKWNVTNVNGYPTRDSGGTVYHELGFTFASAINYFDEALKRGIDVDAIAPNVSWLWYVHIDFLEEIAKFRAARRIWAKIIKDRYGAKNPKSWTLRMHAQTGGGAYTYQQPENNIVRGTIGGMAAALGGVQSMAIACFDEALSIPSENAHRLSIRTQQILCHESGIANVVDPFAGSYFMEWLTNEVEKRTWEVIQEVESRGGMAKCVDTGYADKILTNQAYKYNKSVENKERILVGVNEFVSEEEEEEPEIFRVTEETERTQLANLKKIKEERNNQEVRKTLDDLRRAAEKNENVMPYCIAAAKVYASEGEIMQALRDIYGEFKPPSIL
ncbi:MAG: methylmalonyl-CoA mutase [Deltaproteobacteria bacterium]|nr:methylmalonyl-CoA mutase [Deltaproteobacteria bacterium]